ncbi:MAG: hypothetical protein KF803_04915 [Cyclobacteriaceae bacterium]|nr:hypothetical protein [Cyclobacteriaceae bacterium]
MEPEKILTQKIRTLEQESVPWKKAEVWFMIHEQISATEKSYRFYYYAAAVVFFMLFNIYQLQQTHIAPITDNQLSTIQEFQVQAVEESRHNQVTETHSNYVGQGSQPHTTNIQSHEVLDSYNEPVEVDVQLAVEEPVIEPVETVVLQEKVKPIVGVIQLPVNHVVSVKPKRKKLFHKLESVEKEFDKNHQNTIVIARIK